MVFVDFARVLLGPLPKSVCDLSYIARMMACNSIILLMTAITIAKYCMIFIWKNLPMMDEDFIATFISTLALLFGLLTSLTKYYQPGRPVFLQVVIMIFRRWNW